MVFRPAPFLLSIAFTDPWVTLKLSVDLRTPFILFSHSPNSYIHIKFDYFQVNLIISKLILKYV